MKGREGMHFKTISLGILCLSFLSLFSVAQEVEIKSASRLIVEIPDSIIQRIDVLFKKAANRNIIIGSIGVAGVGVSFLGITKLAYNEPTDDPNYYKKGWRLVGLGALMTGCAYYFSS